MVGCGEDGRRKSRNPWPESVVVFVIQAGGEREANGSDTLVDKLLHRQCVGIIYENLGL